MKTLFGLSFVLFLANFTFAQQQTASIDNNPQATASTEIDWANFENELNKLSDEDWSFHTNQESKLLYIDFESLGGKMARLQVKSSEKTVVIEDNRLFDLPVNTIYEVNLEKLKRGSYFVELYTYDDKLIREKITIN